MTWIANAQSTSRLILPALVALALSGQAVSAATIVIKNGGPAEVQIGFDGAPAIRVAPRSTARLVLNDGEHSIQCSVDGIYDGCNIADRFTAGEVRELTLNLIPFIALPHAVELAQQGMLLMETRQDGAWATNTLDVAGAAEDCADYAKGPLGAVSRSLRARMPIRNATLAMQTLCGTSRPALAATVDGAQLYVPLRFVTFKEKNGRPVLVRP
jgi:hypothetical protein